MTDTVLPTTTPWGVDQLPERPGRLEPRTRVPAAKSAGSPPVADPPGDETTTPRKGARGGRCWHEGQGGGEAIFRLEGPVIEKDATCSWGSTRATRNERKLV